MQGAAGTTQHSKPQRPPVLGLTPPHKVHHDPMETDEPFLFSPQIRSRRSSAYRNTEDAGHTPHVSSRPSSTSVPSPPTPDIQPDSGSPTILWCCIPPASQATVHWSTTHRPHTGAKILPQHNGMMQPVPMVHVSSQNVPAPLQQTQTRRTRPSSRRFPTSPKPMSFSTLSQEASSQHPHGVPHHDTTHAPSHRGSSHPSSHALSRSVTKAISETMASFHIQRTDYAPPHGRCRSMLEYQSCQARQYQTALAQGREPCTLFELL